MEILLTLALFAPVVWLLERTHRRTRDLPRVPFGADADSEASRVYREQLAELRYAAQALDQSPDVVATTVDRPVASVPSRLERTLGASFSPLGGWSGTATIVKPC